MKSQIKILFRNAIHVTDNSHEATFAEYKGRKLKFLYQSYNAVERFNVELFDGDKWNILIIMSDLGQTPNSTSYVGAPIKRSARAKELYEMSIELVKKLID